MTATYDLTIRQGDTWRRSLGVADVDGGPVDLTGASARLQIRADPADADDEPVLELAVGDGIDIDEEAGSIDMTADAGVTAELEPGSYVYDLEVTWSSGDVEKILEGPATVVRSVTRP